MEEAYPIAENGKSDTDYVLMIQHDPSSPEAADALNNLFLKYRVLLANWLAFKFPALNHLVEDIAQEALTAALFTHIERFNPGSVNFNTWLYAIAKNHAYDAMRRPDFRKTEATSPDAMERNVGGYDPSEEVLSGIYLDDKIGALKGELTPAKLRALGYKLLGVTQKEAAKLEGIPWGTVNSRSRCAKEAARTVLSSL